MSLRQSFIAVVLSVSVSFTALGARTARADDSISMDVTVTTSEAGAFAVTLRGIGDTDPSFGSVSVDAILDLPITGEFVVEYTDTYTERNASQVTISVESFEPSIAVPPFAGSDQVQFQIPNRYLELTDVGAVVTGPPPESCAIPVGEITGDVSDEGETFDDGASRIVANVAQGCGVGTASQPIELTLTVPAGVYPTIYSATVTIETTID